LSQAVASKAGFLAKSVFRLPLLGPFGIGVGVAALGVAIWWIATSGTYESGDDIGYNLGLAGGLLMLALFVYPLRKRVKALANAGQIRHWFSLHMALGIAGPILILLHSRLHLASLNASVAFWCMVLVASSGVVGRFLYRQIHHGLYGRRSSLSELRMRAGLGAEEVKSWMKWLPQVQELLEAYGQAAEEGGRNGLRHPLQFFLLGPRSLVTWRKARAALHRDLPVIASARHWDEETLRRRLAKGERLISAYLAHSRAIAQLTAYEQLFALWHILHVPLVWMMVITAVVHVLYVHMY